MHYKTIALEMLKQRTGLHEELRSAGTLLETMEGYAHELKASHEAWMQSLSQARPDSDSSQIRSEAMELALKDLEERLPPESSAGE